MAQAAKLARVSVVGDLASVTAGEKFFLVVELAEKPVTDSVTVTFIGQRLLQESGVFSLSPIEPGYMVYTPNPVVISPGEKFAISDVVATERKPASTPGYPPIAFPEHLLFSAWIQGDYSSFQSVSVRIEEYIA